MKKATNKKSHFIIWLIVIVMACTALVGIIGWLSDGFSNLSPSTWFSPDIVDPVEPIDPTDPTDPVEPVDPIDPTDPVNWTDPSLFEIDESGSVVSYAGVGITDIVIPTIINDIEVISLSGGLFSGNTEIETVIIPEGIINIETRTFYYCSYLKSVKIPDSVTTIDNSAFYGCVSLSSIKLPIALVSLEKLCFSKSGLTSIEMPKTIDDNLSILNIADSAFASCPLEKIYFPKRSVESDEYEYMLNSCSLSSINDLVICYEGTSTEWTNNIALKSNWTYNSTYKIKYECTFDEYNVLSPDAIDDIINPADFGVYYYSGGCTITGYSGNAKNIVIPSYFEGFPVTSITEGAFVDNEKIESVVFPEFVESVYDMSFSGCENLYKIYFYGGINITVIQAFFGMPSLTLCYQLNEQSFSNAVSLSYFWTNANDIGFVYDCTLEQFNSL